MSLLKSGQPGKAAEYINLAEQQEECVNELGCLIRLQAILQQSAAGKAGEGSAHRTAVQAAYFQEQEAVVAAVGSLVLASPMSNEALKVSSE